MKNIMEILKKHLRHDGDDYALLNGYKFVLTTDSDEGTTINDYDCYGEVAYYDLHGDRRRPDHFTGAAEKITTYHGDTYWWEPYREGRKVYRTTQDRQMVLNILTYGYYVYTVTVYEECKVVNSKGETVSEAWHEIDSASLGGIEPMLDDDAIADVVDQLLYDLTDYMEKN